MTADERAKLADDLEAYASKYSDDWTMASPEISWDSLKSIVAALRAPEADAGAVADGFVLAGAAFAEVVRQADAVHADERNDIQDRRAIRNFADRFRIGDEGCRVRISTPTAAGIAAPPAVTWPQPIASAPTDGSEFIGHQCGDVYRCCWRTEEPDEGPPHSGWWDFSNESFEGPTEWQPLRHAAPPAASADAVRVGAKLGCRRCGAWGTVWRDGARWTCDLCNGSCVDPDQSELTAPVAGADAGIDHLWGRFVNHYWDSLEADKEIVLPHVKAVLDYHRENSALPASGESDAGMRERAALKAAAGVKIGDPDTTVYTATGHENTYSLDQIMEFADRRVRAAIRALSPDAGLGEPQR